MGCCRSKEETKYCVNFSPKNSTRLNKFNYSFNDKETIDKSSSLMLSKSGINNDYKKKDFLENNLTINNKNEKENEITINNVLTLQKYINTENEYHKSMNEKPQECIVVTEMGNEEIKMPPTISYANESRNLKKKFKPDKNEESFKNNKDETNDNFYLCLQPNYYSSNISMDKENIHTYFVKKSEDNKRKLRTDVNSLERSKQYRFDSNDLSVRSNKILPKYNTIETNEGSKTSKVKSSRLSRINLSTFPASENNIFRKKKSQKVKNINSNTKFNSYNAIPKDLSISNPITNEFPIDLKCTRTNLFGSGLSRIHRKKNYSLQIKNKYETNLNFIDYGTNNSSNIENKNLITINNTSGLSEGRKAPELSLDKLIQVFGDVVKKDNSKLPSETFRNNKRISNEGCDITSLRKLSSEKSKSNSNYAPLKRCIRNTVIKLNKV